MRNFTMAIVGSDSLLGREIRHVLSEQAPGVKVQLIGDEAEAAIVTERDGEPVVISTLDESSIASTQVIFLTGTPESCQRTIEMAETASPRPALIDLTQGFDDLAEVRLLAPMVQPPDSSDCASGRYRIAHPAAIVLAEFFKKLHAAFPVLRSLVHVLAPASERGREGIEELQQQTVGLLSFKPLQQEVFGAQLSFSMLARYGSDVRPQLEAIEGLIAGHLAELLRKSGNIPSPSLRLLQAPVFHGYCFSVWVEFAAPANPKKVIKALASKRIEVRGVDEGPASNSGITGQSGMTVGRVEGDRQNPNAAWFWIVADNHRVAAENAACLAQLLVPAEGSA